MTNIPANLYSKDVRVDLARAILLLQSIATPSPASTANTTAGTAAFKANPGIKGFLGSFWAVEENGKSIFRAELPCNVKLLGTYSDIRKSIAPLPSVVTATWSGPVGTGSITPVADTLERYTYDRALDFEANKNAEEKVLITPQVDTVTGRAYILIEAEIDSPLVDLLATGDSSGGGGGGGVES
jgi:hypothetical protein